jgi:ABC-2 type transport system permease protein
MGFAWAQLDLAVHLMDIVIFALFVLGSVLIYAGVYMILTAIGFFVDAPTGILPLVWNLQNYGRYPVKIYNKIMQVILTWILPFAFVGFYPAAYFLDAANWQKMAFITPLVGIVFFTFALMFWNYGVKRYRGAGS